MCRLFVTRRLATASLALADEPLHARLLAGIAVAIGGLALAFGESLALGDAEWALLAAIACALAPLASVAIKRRGAALDAVVLNGWAMLGGGRHSPSARRSTTSASRWPPWPGRSWWRVATPSRSGRAAARPSRRTRA